MAGMRTIDELVAEARVRLDRVSPTELAAEQAAGALVVDIRNAEQRQRDGELAGAAQLRGRPRPQNDTWIAACCLRYQVPLVTLNTADFSDFTTRHGLMLLGEQM